MTGTSVVVLSGKGGVAKSFWQLLTAGEASRAGIATLLIDADSERNLSAKWHVPAHATGLGSVLEDAGVTGAETNIAAGGKRVAAELRDTGWAGVDLLPAGASLTGVGQVNIADTWLLRDILTTAGIYDRYELILLDTAGRTGSLVTQAMYAADVAYAPVMNSSDAIRKAREARERVERIQRAHPLRWAGVVLTGFDHRRSSMDAAIREQAYESLGEQVRAEIPRRALVHEAYQLTERLGDRREVAAAGLAGIIAAFLHRDLLGRTDLCEIPTEGVLR